DVEREREAQLGRAGRAAYRAALAGKPTADEARPSDRPTPVTFRDLWERPEAHRGRRVTIRGRLERAFRQGAIGSFPPLVEAWIFSASGDPICAVFPRPETPAGAGIPGPGRAVRFTGTFLKMVRYAAGDGERM